MENVDIVTGVYLHYKGNKYEVMGEVVRLISNVLAKSFLFPSIFLRITKSLRDGLFTVQSKMRYYINVTILNRQDIII